MATTALQTQFAPTPDAASPRIRHLLNTAWGQFRAHGYSKVSVDSIARESGVSKETIYRYFEGKEAIFRAALDHSGRSFLDTLPNLDGKARLDPADLHACVRAIYQASLNRDRPAVFWLSISVASAFPELAVSLHHEGRAWLAPVARYLETHIRPRLSPTDAKEAANRLGALAIEGPAQLMGAHPLRGAERDQLALRVTHLLLWGCPTPARPLRGPGKPLLVKPEPIPAVKPPARLAEFAGAAPHLRKLLDVARSDFYASGYVEANLDKIGEAARVGRGTLYRHFENKAGLFKAAMLDAAHAVASKGLRFNVPAGASFDSGLEQAAFAVSGIFLDPATIQLYRAVISEQNWSPDLARQVYTISRAPLLAAIVSMLADHQSQGRILVDDLAWWAMQFMTMATAGNRYLSLKKPPGIAARRQMAKSTAALFAQGIAQNI